MPSAESALPLAAPCALALASPATPFGSARDAEGASRGLEPLDAVADRDEAAIAAEADGASSAELGFAGSDGLASAFVPVAVFASLDVAESFESSARDADVGSFERSSFFESLAAAADVEPFELAADFESLELGERLASLTLGADSSLLALFARSSSLVADSELLPLVAAASVVALGASCFAAFTLGDGASPSACASSVQFDSLAIGAVFAETVGASALPARVASVDCRAPPIADSTLDSLAGWSFPSALAPPPAPASGTRR